jgi:hypothetical protein
MLLNFIEGFKLFNYNFVGNMHHIYLFFKWGKLAVFYCHFPSNQIYEAASNK